MKKLNVLIMLLLFATPVLAGKGVGMVTTTKDFGEVSKGENYTIQVGIQPFHIGYLPNGTRTRFQEELYIVYTTQSPLISLTNEWLMTDITHCRLLVLSVPEDIDNGNYSREFCALTKDGIFFTGACNWFTFEVI